MAPYNAARVTLSSLSCLRLFCVAVPCPRFLGLSFLWPQFHSSQHHAHDTITLRALTTRKATGQTYRPSCLTVGACSELDLFVPVTAPALYSCISGCVGKNASASTPSAHLPAFLLPAA